MGRAEKYGKEEFLLSFHFAHNKNFILTKSAVENEPSNLKSTIKKEELTINPLWDIDEVVPHVFNMERESS